VGLENGHGGLSVSWAGVFVSWGEARYSPVQDLGGVALVLSVWRLTPEDRKICSRSHAPARTWDWGVARALCPRGTNGRWCGWRRRGRAAGFWGAVVILPIAQRVQGVNVPALARVVWSADCLGVMGPRRDYRLQLCEGTERRLGHRQHDFAVGHPVAECAVVDHRCCPHVVLSVLRRVQH
jgi:hypothetical protein